MKPSAAVASFDSASATLRATAHYLRGEDAPLLGVAPQGVARALSPIIGGVNALPRRVRESLYTWSGHNEAIVPEKLKEVRAEEVAEWMTGLYPKKRYPAVAIGSSNGAATHLYAALGIPWLPQTFLVPVRRSGVHPDEPNDDLVWGAARPRAFGSQP